MVIGEGKNEVSLTDVENAAHAQLCAAERLNPSASCAGRAYFIGQEQPVVIWEWLGALFERLGVPAPSQRISRRTATCLGVVCEGLWRVLPLSGEPPMTRFVALQLASSHSYDLANAKAELGYRELVSLEEMTERIVSEFGS